MGRLLLLYANYDQRHDVDDQATKDKQAIVCNYISAVPLSKNLQGHRYAQKVFRPRVRVRARGKGANRYRFGGAAYSLPYPTVKVFSVL